MQAGLRASTVAKLFDAEGCARVFVVWDLIPSNEEHQHEGKPCRKKERDHLLGTLRPQDRRRTVLLCIQQELETWLLVDGAALTAVIKRPSHPMKAIRGERDPEAIKNPKGRLRELFNKNKRGDSSDSVHAVKIIRGVTSLSRLECAPSFARFKQKLEAL